jgi:hypothetical protein
MDSNSTTPRGKTAPRILIPGSKQRAKAGRSKREPRGLSLLRREARSECSIC